MNQSNFFSHNFNARNDNKIINLRMKLGAEGYGIFFMLLERLGDEANYMSIKDYNAIAFDLRVDTSKVKSVVEDFGLFVFTENGEYFYSESFNERMAIKDNIKKKKSIAGKKGAEKRWETEKNSSAIAEPSEKNSSAIAEPSEKNSSAIAEPSENIAIKQKEIKQKETKLNNNKENLIFDNQDVVKVAKFYVDAGFGQINTFVSENLQHLIADFSIEWIEEAFRIAAEKNVHNLKYVTSILENWRSKGKSNNSSKKTKFHNFKQQSDDYSEEELNDLVRKKREAFMKQEW